MSQENVEVVRAGFEAYNRGDVDALLGLLDPQVEWTDQFVEGGTFRGREGVHEFLGWAW
jgi:ketosteroid isomerase-like protein